MRTLVMATLAEVIKEPVLLGLAETRVQEAIRSLGSLDMTMENQARLNCRVNHVLAELKLEGILKGSIVAGSIRDENRSYRIIYWKTSP
jgi:hypothetical protein